MATADYVEWLARGRAHQTEGRPVDALLCFRQAARADATAPDVHFHLGEVLWQLGRLSDATAAWREALRIEPQFLAPAQALAEASLALNEGTAARQAADRVLVLVPGDLRAEAIAGIAAMMAALANASSATAPAVKVRRSVASAPTTSPAPTTGFENFDVGAYLSGLGVPATMDLLLDNFEKVFQKVDEIGR